MIYKRHDKDDDKVTAYVVYHKLDKVGNFDINGEFLYVEDVWIHKSDREKNIVFLMYRWLTDVLPSHPTVKYLYWVRYKYGDRMSAYEVLRGKRIKLIKKEI